MRLDDTHDTARRSWAPGADTGDFPLQNLPLGIFSPPDGVPRPGIAIGDSHPRPASGRVAAADLNA